MNTLPQKFNTLALTVYCKFGQKVLLPIVLLFGAQASAQTWNTPIVPWNPTDISDFGTLVNQIINFVAAFVGVVAVLYLIMSGFNYIMSQGNAKKVAAAKNAMMNAIIGIVIVIIAYIIVRLVLVDLLNIKQRASWQS